MENNNVELRVSGTTAPNKLGGAIVKYLNETPKIILLAMGDKAVSQAVKGVIVAQSFLASSALDFNLKMGFKTNKDTKSDREVTVIAFYISRNW
jgi:stage V sporulation protein S